jgi:peptide/nickel transport system permease protein
MTLPELPPQVEPETAPPEKRSSYFSRVIKYIVVRFFTLALMLVIGMFIAVIVLNFGGFVDKIHEANIFEALNFVSYSMPGASVEEIKAASDQLSAQMYHAYGLDQPFLVRCARWTFEALTLNLGQPGQQYRFGVLLPIVRDILLNRLPYTLLLFSVSNLIFFFASLFLALFLFRHHESFLDRLIIFLSPISSIPNWLFGVFLVIIFCALIPIAPFPRSFTQGINYYLQANPIYFLKYMILPVAAIFLSMFFQSAYAWRTYFLLQAGEDYLELAKAKGLPDKVVQRRYLIRPSLPYIITTFAMTMIGIWQTAFILEKFFFWPGIGSLFFESINNFSITGNIIALFAYLLVITVFLLDVVYALVDPRVRLDSGQKAGKVVRGEGWWGRLRRVQRGSRGAAPWDKQPRAQRPVLEKAASRVEHVPVAHPFGKGLRSAWGEVRKYPSAIFGLAIIAVLIGVSIYTFFAYPYQQTLLQWRGDNGIWENTPLMAQPAWSNWFRREKLPLTIIVDENNPSVTKTVEIISAEVRKINITFPFDYPYDGYPQDLVVNIQSDFDKKRPMLVLMWITPDGREVEISTSIPTSDYRYSYRFSSGITAADFVANNALTTHWEELFTANGKVGDPTVHGTYYLRLSEYVFEPQADVSANLVLYGQVYGLAGTDDYRRDLKLALLWGTPFSLLFGLLGAFGTGVLAMVIAATSVWFGGWVDALIQRITEINMLLPALPMAIMIYFLYTKNIWVILGVIILLSVFGSALKNYRAAFMQIKSAGYIQAAQVYGAGNVRIITHYLVPRIIPLLVPQLVALVPSYIFLEPTLAFIGVGDPLLPTWGKILMTALYISEKDNMFYYMTLMREPYLALEPLVLMFITGLAFSLLGMALDRIFNPRLRNL